MATFSKNKIKGELPMFTKFKSIYSLDLSHNQITQLKNNAFDIDSLAKLSMNDNLISKSYPIMIS